MSSHKTLHGEVGLADALIALSRLPLGQRKKAMLWLPEILGIALPTQIASDGPTTVPPPDDLTPSPTPGPGATPAESDHGTKAPAPAVPPKSPEATDRNYAPTLPSQLTWDDDTATTGYDWREEARENPLSDPVPFNFDDLPDLEPLFEPRRNRSVLSGALSTSKREGDLDLDEILRRLANCEPILDLPRLPTPTTRLGIQLLMDRGRGLLPYHRDQILLKKEIEHIMGRDRVATLKFADLPGNGVGTGTRRRWTDPYRPPAPGVPVVLLSDLGIGLERNAQTGAPPEDWERFAKIVRTAGCPLLAIVPAAADRVPQSLRPLIGILPWSRTTTIATVRKFIGRGLKATS